MMNDVVIIGSGLAGLSCAWHLKEKGIAARVLERNSRAGGLCRTETVNGFSFDHSIHILYSGDEYASSLIKNVLLEGNWAAQVRESYCYSYGTFTEYPYQAHNFGLPGEVIVENLIGLIEATFSKEEPSQSKHFEEWIVRTFGEGIAKNFMIPYNRRVWAWDLKEMNFDWIAERVPRPEVRDVLEGALREPRKKFGPNSEFWYPKEGGIEALPRGFLPHLEGRISLCTDVRSIDPIKKKLTVADGDGRLSEIPYGTLVTTVPLPRLLGLMTEKLPGDPPPPPAEAFRHNVVHTVNLGLVGPDLPPFHWVYYPLEETVFHRISFPHLYSPTMAPEGHQSIMCEVSESPYRPRDTKKLIAQCVADLKKTGILHEEHTIVHESIKTLDPAYVIYDLDHRRNVDALHCACRDADIHPCGRFGDWEYLNMDHSILSGKRIADEIAGA